MSDTLRGRFETRREAELAVEHLVQQEGVDRSAISAAPLGDDNTVGTRLAGADKVDGHGAEVMRDDAPVEGAVQVVVNASAEKVEAVGKALGVRN